MEIVSYLSSELNKVLPNENYDAKRCKAILYAACTVSFVFNLCMAACFRSFFFLAGAGFSLFGREVIEESMPKFLGKVPQIRYHNIILLYQIPESK